MPRPPHCRPAASTRRRAARLAAAAAIMVGACTASIADPGPTGSTGDGTMVSSTSAVPPSTTATPSSSTSPISTASTTTTTIPLVHPIRGRVIDGDGDPISGARVRLGDLAGITGSDGAFDLGLAGPGLVTVSRPGWVAAVALWEKDPLVLQLEPIVVRALRVSADAAGDAAKFAALLDMAVHSTVNALVFDTKSETGQVHYETSVEEATAIGAVRDHYDPTAVIGAARSRGLYTITRIVVFEDPIRSRERRDVKLAGTWVDPTNPESHAYPLALAEEACLLGFDEIQFDYVRFPTGITARAAGSRRPAGEADRIEAIARFLSEGRDRLHELGCAVSADLFAIVMSAPNDQGIGQRPEDLSPLVDAISPMIYPSHYDSGWLGFPDPNAHPAPVVAGALDDGFARLAPTTQMRPWLQAFYYNGAQVLSQIAEAEERGAGWMLWNAGSNYDPSWLPRRNGPRAPVSLFE